jgi:hypothetical protein
MVLTRRSIISQPNRLYTRNGSSLVPVLFSLTENNTKSYYSIDRHSGFRRVCPDCPIFFLFYIYLFFGQSIYDYRLVLSSLISPLQFFGLIPQFPKVLPIYVNYVTTVSSSSQCTPICSGNHPPYTLDSERTIPLPSPLQ